ncbi:hypothetical protein LOK49_LG12G02180 [Camellia lanceoleosa]|uniref:Uncharacterized protein n=1 Tax=Camellia lanceoleosa TaxID=1840588 RepID=A0ACC0FSQ1_9ERIC|nr:hypothetical protein LOK49_LG12G02180 [Camellia lanceoleosa]
MSHAMVVALCFPTVRSVANRPKQRANTKKALTRIETGAAAEQQFRAVLKLVPSTVLQWHLKVPMTCNGLVYIDKRSMDIRIA